MRLLFVAAPLQGHVLPLIPLAAACRDAGHDVTVAAGSFPPEVLGLRTADIGGSFNLARSAIRVALRRPGLARSEMRGTAGTAMVGELFGRANLSLIGPLLAVAERERPDLIVYEPRPRPGPSWPGACRCRRCCRRTRCGRRRSWSGRWRPARPWPGRRFRPRS